MTIPKVYISVLFLTFTGASLMLLAGCTTYGKVYVSRPQVFTRERLVAAREKEIQFLKSSLEAAVPFTFQGAKDVRELTAFQNSLAATISPTAGLSTPATASPATLSDATKLMPGGAVSSMDLARGVSVTSVDHFSDVMAYRDAVNAVIREKELDDTHDREGTALYTLKFNTALIPGNNSKRAAIVKMVIELPKQCETDYDEVYHRWIQRLSAQRQEDEDGLSERFHRGLNNTSDMALINDVHAGTEDFCVIATNKIKDPKTLETYVGYVREAALKTVNIITLVPDARREQIRNTVTDTAQRDFLFTGMQMALNARYCRDFAGLASIDYNFDQYATNNTVVTCRMVGYTTNSDPYGRWWSRAEWSSRPQTNGGLPYFTHVVTNWNQPPYVDSIDPQIYAQNISDVSSQTKLLELALTVNAAVAKPASISNTAKYIRESQELLQAIKRQPLALGFSGGAEFGWMLGPPFSVEDGEAAFLQMPTRQSFAVSVVVPAWVRTVTLKGTNYWIDTDGAEIKPEPLPTTSIALPHDMDALTSGIRSRESRLKPILYTSGDTLRVATNANQTLLIQGRELWRNPAVFVGSTRADFVDLLPNMSGLLAHFRSIPAIYEGTNQDLTVVTSFGVDKLEKSIEIISPGKPETSSPPQAKLTNAFAVNGGPGLGFALTSMPSGFAGFSVRTATKEAPGKWQALSESDYKLATNNTAISVSMKITDSPPTGPTDYMVELGLRNTPFASPRSLMPGTNQLTFLYFPVKDQEKPQVPGMTITYTKETPDLPSIRISLAPTVMRAHLYSAYPGFEKAVGNKKALLYFGVKGAPDKRSKAKLALQEDGAGWVVIMTGISVGELGAEVFDASIIEYPTPDGTAAQIDVAGGPVTIKRP